MAIGDLSDMLARIKTALPSKWFADGLQITTVGSQQVVTPSQTPVLDGFMSGPAYVWSWVFSFLEWVATQTRISTASGLLLDLIASDYFGEYIRRRVGEPDTSLRARIKKELLRPKGTRAAVIQAVTDLTGRAPIVFEPANTGDTGGYGFQGMTVGTGLAYAGTGSSGAGGWGSLKLPFQFFIHAFRAIGGGIANVAGYYTGSGWAGGGYNHGAIEWADLDMTQGQITDQDIYDVINKVRPAATIAWTALT